MSKRIKEEQLTLPSVGAKTGTVLRTYTFEHLDALARKLREKIQASEPKIIAHLDTLCRLAPGSQEAAFGAIMMTLPRESHLRAKVKKLRLLTLYIQAMERAAIGGVEPSATASLPAEEIEQITMEI